MYENIVQLKLDLFIIFTSYNMLDQNNSREQLNRSIRTADRIRGYIQDTVMYLSQEEKRQIFSMLAEKMNIKTEAKALLDKILSSKKSQWQENKSLKPSIKRWRIRREHLVVDERLLIENL